MALSFLKLVSGDYLLQTDGTSKIILRQPFPGPIEFHEIEFIKPTPQNPVRVFVTDLNL